MVVELAGSDIHWSEPRDLSIEEMTFRINARVKDISSNHSGGANVLFCGGQVVTVGGGAQQDRGRVEFLSEDTSPEILKAMCTIRGGEPMPPTLR